MLDALPPELWIQGWRYIKHSEANRGREIRGVSRNTPEVRGWPFWSVSWPASTEPQCGSRQLPQQPQHKPLHLQEKDGCHVHDPRYCMHCDPRTICSSNVEITTFTAAFQGMCSERHGLHAGPAHFVDDRAWRNVYLRTSLR